MSNETKIIKCYVLHYITITIINAYYDIATLLIYSENIDYITIHINFLLTI